MHRYCFLLHEKQGADKQHLPGQADRKAGLFFIGEKADFSFGFFNDLGNNGKSGTVAFFFFGGKTLLKNESLMLFGNSGPVIADGKGIESAVLAVEIRQDSKVSCC